MFVFMDKDTGSPKASGSYEVFSLIIKKYISLSFTTNEYSVHTHSGLHLWPHDSKDGGYKYNLNVLLVQFFFKQFTCFKIAAEWKDLCIAVLSQLSF